MYYTNNDSILRSTICPTCIGIKNTCLYISWCFEATPPQLFLPRMLIKMLKWPYLTHHPASARNGSDDGFYYPHSVLRACFILITISVRNPSCICSATKDSYTWRTFLRSVSPEKVEEKKKSRSRSRSGSRSPVRRNSSKQRSRSSTPVR